MATLYIVKRPKPFVVQWGKKPNRKSRAFSDKHAAESFKLEMDMNDAPSEDCPLAVAAGLYIREVMRVSPSRSTPAKYHVDLSSLCNHVGTTTVASLTADEVRGWRDAMLQKKANRTVAMALKTIRTFLKWCAARGYCRINVATAVEIPKWKESIVDWPDKMMVDTIIAAARTSSVLDPAQRRIKVLTYPQSYPWRILTVAGYAGLRRAEILTLKWEHVKFNDKLLLVHGKSKYPRTVDMHPNVVAALFDLPRTSTYVFHSPHFPDSPATFQITREICRWMRRNGWSYDIHSFRHSCASRLAALPGMTVEILMQLMGWTTPRQAVRYMHSVAPQRAALVSAL